MFKSDIQNIHLVGIGGVGMCGIAEVLLNLGLKVSGSDVVNSEVIERLRLLGGKIYIGHSENNVEKADVIVVSTAIAKDNIEVIKAKELKIPVIPRAEMLGELMRLKKGIAISGAHGKTSTTSMVSLILSKAGLDPTIVIGGKFNNLASNAKFGGGEYFVAEADESDGSFLNLLPIYAIVTNIDYEHLDYYQDLKEIKQTFISFINKVPFYGWVVLCLDDANIRSILPEIKRRYITYGLETDAQVKAINLVSKEFSSYFEVVYHGQNLGQIRINVPGRQYVNNSLAAIGMALELDISYEIIKKALSSYRSVERRFQIKGNVNGILIIDDYAHHPTEIKATLESASKSVKRRIIVVFQPHRFSRTKFLYQEFGKAFHLAHEVIVTDIYAAGEAPIEGVEASLIVEEIRKNGQDKVRYISNFEEIIRYLKKIAQPNDLIITLGAGNIYQVSSNLVKELKNKDVVLG
ncbi:UDP-N-acetylmuramate--L-alanine ligase [bacterium]|nr:UDP-N-acetylmuramate--L-alanine ligase [bacterium]MBU1153486.1 UDP-N-acetylmuramate--L-alanine ligase [bacterium]